MDNTHLFSSGGGGRQLFFPRSLSCSFIMPLQSIWPEAKTTVFHTELKESNLSSTTLPWQRMVLSKSWHACAPLQHRTNALLLHTTALFSNFSVTARTEKSSTMAGIIHPAQHIRARRCCQTAVGCRKDSHITLAWLGTTRKQRNFCGTS